MPTPNIPGIRTAIAPSTHAYQEPGYPEELKAHIHTVKAISNGQMFHPYVRVSDYCKKK